MDTRQVFLPALAMVALTFVVWVRMYVVRIGQMRRERIHPQSIAMSAQVAQRLSDTRASDNFRNLFELPVLFYAALAATAWTGQGEATLVLALAWLFVALRIVHSIIQCGYNKVMHRFWAYIAGAMVLWTLWGAIAWRWWNR